MANYLLSFRGGAASSDPDEQAAVMGKWNQWYAELGDAIDDEGDAVGAHATIQADGSVAHAADEAAAITGYAVIEADSLDAAIELARSNPIFATGGWIEVGELLGLMSSDTDDAADDESEPVDEGTLAEVTA